MSTLGALPHERIELDPNVAHPPFAVWLVLPSNFFILDTNPSTWHRSTEILIREAFHGSRLSSSERRSAFTVLEQLVANCQRGGVALSVIRMGRLSDGQVASAGIQLAWANEKRESSLGRVRDMLPRSGTADEIQTPVGPAIIHRSRSNAQVPGTAKIVSMAKIQLFIPVPNTTWTAIFSTASAFPELTTALDKLMLQIAGAFNRVDQDEDGPADPTDASDSTQPSDPTEPDFEPTGSSAGPGFHRGFGTYLRRQVGPAADNAADANGSGRSAPDEPDEEHPGRNGLS